MTDVDLDPLADRIAGLDDCAPGWDEPRPVENLPDISTYQEQQ